VKQIAPHAPFTFAKVTRGNGVVDLASGGRKAVCELYASILGRLARRANGAQQCAVSSIHVSAQQAGSVDLGGPKAGGGEMLTPLDYQKTLNPTFRRNVSRSGVLSVSVSDLRPAQPSPPLRSRSPPGDHQADGTGERARGALVHSAG
jgi:hypothetical protein